MGSFVMSMEKLLYTFGLGTPLARGVFFAGLTTLPVMYFKLPISYAHTKEGFTIPKKWSLFADSDIPPEYKTSFPWFIWPILGLAFGALLL